MGTTQSNLTPSFKRNPSHSTWTLWLCGDLEAMVGTKWHLPYGRSTLPSIYSTFNFISVSVLYIKAIKLRGTLCYTCDDCACVVPNRNAPHLSVSLSQKTGVTVQSVVWLLCTRSYIFEHGAVSRFVHTFPYQWCTVTESAQMVHVPVRAPCVTREEYKYLGLGSS